MDKDVKAQVQQLKNLRLQVNTVKKELNKLNREKETWFRKRSDINKQITAIIGDVKGSKDERNEITGKVKSFKEERNKLNKEISEKVAELKKLKSEYDEASSKKGARVDPSQVEKQIEKLDYVLQTQPMSFKKEQDLMKQLKLLKKQLVDMSGSLGEWKKIAELNKEIRKLRKQSNVAHKEIQKRASESQEKHEVVVERSKEIDELKAQEREAYEKFKEYKKLFTEKNDELKKILQEADKLKEVLEEHNIALEEDKKKQEEKAVKEKAKEVNEKIKTGKKLTTEDLLVFQKASNK